MEGDQELYSTEGDYGLRTLAEPKEVIADVVFVHGLTGNRETTWTHKATKIFWPQALLPADLPNIRIFTWGYDADVVRAIDTAGSETLRDHGKSLAFDLTMRRMQTSSNERPLIFVAHSLGGLVVEQALLISRGLSEQYYKDILRSTYGIIFLGTPHMGSSKANWAAPLTRLSNIVRTTNKRIVDVLEPGSEMLTNLQQEFHTMLDDRHRNDKKYMQIFCFFEVINMPGVGMIVPQPSAVLSAYPSRSIHANHVNMTKFTGSKDAGYINVKDQLWIWVFTLRQEKERSEAAAASAAAAAAQPSVEDVRDKRNQKFATMADVADQNTATNSGTYNSNGGTMFVGNQFSAGRNINIGQGRGR